jgi:diaminohydroxyphosphoribosylaminopyrimidine deaminase/5-amino-6-(5-phosphoribosylamino)uracil reductase
MRPIKKKTNFFKKKGIQLIKSNLTQKKHFNLKKILKKLYQTGCRNLLVEGGNDLSGSFLKKKLFNEFYLFKSPKTLSKLVEYKDFTFFNDLSRKYINKKKIYTQFGKDSITLYKR